MSTGARSSFNPERLGLGTAWSDPSSGVDRIPEGRAVHPGVVKACGSETGFKEINVLNSASETCSGNGGCGLSLRSWITGKPEEVPLTHERGPLLHFSIRSLSTSEGLIRQSCLSFLPWPFKIRTMAIMVFQFLVVAGTPNSLSIWPR